MKTCFFHFFTWETKRQDYLLVKLLQVVSYLNYLNYLIKKILQAQFEIHILLLNGKSEKDYTRNYQTQLIINIFQEFY